MTLVAAVQMTSGADTARNVETATRLVKKAAAQGATLIGLPENFSWMGLEEDRPNHAESLEGATLSRLAGVARELKVTLLAGSVLESGAPGGRLYNTSALFGPDGARLGVYRKIHLFDVEVGDGATYRESAAVAPGKEVVVAETAAGKLGMSVCYDLRFPELYRAQAAQGATIISVPAAFTLMTGKDHWEVLLRARAIENQAYVFAPAQWGRHPPNRQTYGHALVIDPWGLVVAKASDGEGFALAAIDPEYQASVRRNLPCLSHRRL
ncbi:MAG: carbon-nitrogen hydrolase family protein [Myxococcaceae bacterium]